MGRDKIKPVVSLIQARMSSTRLPGKVLLPLGGATVLDQVLRRAKSFSHQVVVCTSVDPSDDSIEVHCREAGVLCVRGSLDNVFARFRVALMHPQTEETEWFARITADCPLLSVDLARRLLAARNKNLDYLCIPPTTLPRGLTVELIRRSIFEAVEIDRLDASEKEHVTLHFYQTPGRYRCLWLDPPAPIAHRDLRLTLDFAEDYALLKALFEGNPDVTAEEAVEHMLTDPKLRSINAHCQQKGAD